MFCRGQRVLREIASGMEYLHAQGYLHLDLKSPNGITPQACSFEHTSIDSEPSDDHAHNHRVVDQASGP